MIYVHIYKLPHCHTKDVEKTMLLIGAFFLEESMLLINIIEIDILIS